MKNPQLKILGVNNKDSWDIWLTNLELALVERGYRKYIQYHKNSDYVYWKTFHNDKKNIYQVGLVFYDFRKYVNTDKDADRIGVMFECMLTDINGRFDLTVSKNISLDEFESIAKNFYDAMSLFTKK